MQESLLTQYAEQVRTLLLLASIIGFLSLGVAMMNDRRSRETDYQTFVTEFLMTRNV